MLSGQNWNISKIFILHFNCEVDAMEQIKNSFYVFHLEILIVAAFYHLQLVAIDSKTFNYAKMYFHPLYIYIL